MDCLIEKPDGTVQKFTLSKVEEDFLKSSSPPKIIWDFPDMKLWLAGKVYRHGMWHVRVTDKNPADVAQR